MAGIAATGGSTNGVLHLLAIAREAGVELTLDDLAEVAARTPVIASLAPSAATSPTTSTPRAGRATLIRELARARLARRRRADGRRRRRSPTETADAPEPDGEIVFTVDAAVQADAALAVLRGNLAPDGSLVKAAGAARSSHRGPARVFDSEEACADAVRARARAARRRARRPLRGPGGRARDARDAERHVVRRRRRARRDRRARHRRPLLRRDARADGRPRRARGGARRPTRRGPRRRHDLDRRRRAAHSRVELDDDELAARLAAWTPPELPYATGVFGRYRALVGSASEGAVLRNGVA